MNIAFVGFRHNHVYGLYRWASENPDVNIVASWEEDEQARKEAASRGVVFNKSSYEEILSDKSIDAVAIGDYYGIRGERIIKALKAGKHIVADKPLCTSLDELAEIKRLSDEKNLKIGCMLDLRYCAAPSVSRELIQSGRLGTIHNISFGGQHPLNYGTRPSWYFEKGKHGGTINDIAVHGMDLIRYITGAELEEVCSARCWNAFAKEEPQFKDCAQFMAVLSGGIGVIADVSYSLPCGCGFSHVQPWRFNFWGDKGMLEFGICDDIVNLSMAGASCVEHIKAEKPQSDAIKDFLADINGCPGFLDTANVIKSTYTVLKIQSFADKSSC